MQTFDPKMILLILVELAIVYLFAAMLAADGWVIYRLLTGQPILPRSPLVARRPVPWGAWTVLLIIFLTTLVLPTAAFLGYAKMNGLLPNRSQARRLAAMPQTPPVRPDGKKHAPQDPPAESEGRPAQKQVGLVNVHPEENSKQSIPKSKEQPTQPDVAALSQSQLKLSFTESLAIQAVSNVILLALAPFILRMTSRAPLRDLGLSFEKWWRQAAVGAVAFLAIEPVLLAIQIGTTRVWDSNTHPLFKMVLDEFSPGVPQLAILLAVFIAPVCEEVLFRGIIQSWLVGRFGRSQTEPPAVLVERLSVPANERWSVTSHTTPERPEVGIEFSDLTEKPAGLPPPPPAAPLEQHVSGLAAIVTISLVFAALHWEQWPAPITVFALSVVIGYVYQRTGSLIAAICMHAMFNGLSTLFLLGLLLLPQSAQHPEVETVKPPAIIPVFSSPRDCACIHCEK